MASGSTENRQQFEEAMKHGHVKVELGKMLIYGAAGSGKTSFKELVVGNPPPSSRDSTSLAVRPTTMYRVNIEGKQWATLKTLSECREFLAKTLVKCNPPAATQPTEVSINNKLGSATTTVRHKQNVLYALLLFLLLLFGFCGCMFQGCSWWHYFCWCLFCYCTYKICTTNYQQLAYFILFPVLYLISLFSVLCPRSIVQTKIPTINTDSRLIRLMDQLSTTMDIKLPPLASFQMLQIIDSGGQPQFHEILPIFLHQLTFYVFVFRLCDNLGSRPEVIFYANDNQ